MKHNIIILSALCIAFAACQPKAVEPGDMFKTEDEVIKMLIQSEPNGYVIYDEAKGGLNQFIADFMTEKGDYEDVRSRAKRNENGNTYYLFSIDTIPTDTIGIYIRGRIVTDDAGGNFYKSMVIQQIVDGKQQALRLSVDLGNGSGLYAMGQEIIIRVNGFAIGRYANQPQLCVPSFNNNLNASSFDGKVGWAPGRIPAARAMQAITRIGLPDTRKLVYDEIKLSDLVTKSNSSGDGYGQSLVDLVTARTEWDGLLVEVKNVHFTGQYATTQGQPTTCTTGNPEDDEYANVFGPTTNNVGYPQSRIITDGSLNFMVSTSEYAKYAHMYLPAKDYVGTIRGVLGFYMDNGAYGATWKTWSISPRDLSDIQLYNGSQIWTPIEWEAGK